VNEPRMVDRMWVGCMCVLEVGPILSYDHGVSTAFYPRRKGSSEREVDMRRNKIGMIATIG